MYVSSKTLAVMLLASLAFTTVNAATPEKKPDEGKKDEGKKDEGKKDEGQKEKELVIVDPYAEAKAPWADALKNFGTLTEEQLAGVGTKNKEVCKEITKEMLKGLSEDKQLAFAAGEGCKETLLKDVKEGEDSVHSVYKVAHDKSHDVSKIGDHVKGDKKRKEFFCPAFKALPPYKEKSDDYRKAAECRGNMVGMAAAMLAIPAAVAMMLL